MQRLHDFIIRYLFSYKENEIRDMITEQISQDILKGMGEINWREMATEQFPILSEEEQCVIINSVPWPIFFTFFSDGGYDENIMDYFEVHRTDKFVPRIELLASCVQILKEKHLEIFVMDLIMGTVTKDPINDTMEEYVSTDNIERAKKYFDHVFQEGYRPDFDAHVAMRKEEIVDDR